MVILKIYSNYFGQTWKRRPDIFETTRFNIIYKQDIVWISLEKRVKMTLGTFKMYCKSLPDPEPVQRKSLILSHRKKSN